MKSLRFFPEISGMFSTFCILLQNFICSNQLHFGLFSVMLESTNNTQTQDMANVHRQNAKEVVQVGEKRKLFQTHY